MIDVLPDHTDAYLQAVGPQPDDVLVEMDEYAEEHGFPHVGPALGGWLQLLTGMVDAERVFEFGSGYGYSAYWFARALDDDGQIVLTEIDEDELALGREFLARGGHESIARFEHGDALDVVERYDGPFDVVLIDHQKHRYVDAFEAAYPDQAEPVTFENVALAIEVFESTLLTPDAPLDRFLRGDADALTETQKEGLHLFAERGCAACHRGINLGGHGYYPFGVVERPDAFVRPEDDLGRYTVTHVEADRYAFKSPTLRNVALTPPYFHSGTVWSLEDAVRLMGDVQLGSELTEDEVDKLTAFMHALTGEQPEVTVPVLPDITDATPRPDPAATLPDPDAAP